MKPVAAPLLKNFAVPVVIAQVFFFEAILGQPFCFQSLDFLSRRLHSGFMFSQVPAVPLRNTGLKTATPTNYPTKHPAMNIAIEMVIIGAPWHIRRDLAWSGTTDFRQDL